MGKGKDGVKRKKKKNYFLSLRERSPFLIM